MDLIQEKTEDPHVQAKEDQVVQSGNHSKSVSISMPVGLMVEMVRQPQQAQESLHMDLGPKEPVEVQLDKEQGVGKVPNDTEDTVGIGVEPVEPQKGWEMLMLDWRSALNSKMQSSTSLGRNHSLETILNLTQEAWRGVDILLGLKGQQHPGQGGAEGAQDRYGLQALM